MPDINYIKEYIMAARKKATKKVSAKKPAKKPAKKASTKSNSKPKAKEKNKPKKKKGDKEFNMKNFALSTGNVIAQVCAVTGIAVLGTYGFGLLGLDPMVGMGVLAALTIGAMIAHYYIKENHPGALSLV